MSLNKTDKWYIKSNSDNKIDKKQDQTDSMVHHKI